MQEVPYDYSRTLLWKDFILCHRIQSPKSSLVKIRSWESMYNKFIVKKTDEEKVPQR